MCNKLVDKAVQKVFKDFKTFNGSSCFYEFGRLFWEDASAGTLLAGKRVCSHSSTSINLYTCAERLEIIQQKCNKAKFWRGEYHAHPKNKGTWAGQLPSPDDIVSNGISVAGSLWELTPPVNGVSDIVLSPEFQIIQSLYFGDVIVFERGKDWEEFDNICSQKECLGSMKNRYSDWHRQTNTNIGTIDHSAFFHEWEFYAKEIGYILGGRVKVTARKVQ